MNHGYEPANDGATLTVGACRSIAADPAGLERALREGRGGRNVRAIGLEGDIVFAARVDRSRTVPELTRAGSFRSADGPEN
jgi:phosphosulfolactate phosphohydrolase-like enzyme